MEEVDDTETAIEVARDYATDDCIGEFGEIMDVRQENETWIVEFRTHTFSARYEHRIRIAPVGNVISHERKNPT